MIADYNIGHPTTVALPKDFSSTEPVSMQDVQGGTSRPIVNSREADFFKEHGYLIKRGLLSNRDQLYKAVEHLWSNVPRDVIKRDDPNTWIDAPEKKWQEGDHERVGKLYGTNWKMRSHGEDGIGTELFLVDEIANHPVMIAIAESFLGAPIKPVERVRGIYAVLPQAPDSVGSLVPHGDYMAAQLSAMVLVDRVDPHGGGFTVWPGSHKQLHMQWDRVHGTTISGSRVEGYRKTRDRVIREIAPVEFSGDCGDVVFWHPRLIHSPGVNQSYKLGDPKVRVIVSVDYQKAGQTYIDDLEFGPGPIYQWWIDTRNFAEDQPSTAENLWDSWAIG